MPDSSSTVTPAILGAWRGQLAATGTRREMRTHYLQHYRDLLPRLTAIYRRLRALPCRLRKTLQVGGESP